LLRQAMLNKSSTTVSKETSIDELEEKGREEWMRGRSDRGRICDKEVLAMLKPANIRGAILGIRFLLLTVLLVPSIRNLINTALQSGGKANHTCH
jgi:hypothetical protein